MLAKDDCWIQLVQEGKRYVKIIGIVNEGKPKSLRGWVSDLKQLLIKDCGFGFVWGHAMQVESNVNYPNNSKIDRRFDHWKTVKIETNDGPLIYKLNRLTKLWLKMGFCLAPSPETDESPALARLANDGMADICKAHPDRFPSFVASLPMNNPEESVKEIDRVIGELDACAVQLFSNVNGEPLDLPKYYPVFERAAQLDVPIFLHPARGPNFPDYLSEEVSKFDLWWTFGWTYESSVAMARIVFSGMFDKLPDIKILTHHLGAMIPYVEGRVGYGQDQMGSRTPGNKLTEFRESLKKRPIDYFKMFYADTALFGSDAGTECGLKFFGPDKCLFASDCPFDPEGGPMYIRETIRVLDKLGISESDRKKLYEDNTRRLLKLN